MVFTFYFFLFSFTLSDMGMSFLRVASCALILSLRLFSAWLWLVEALATLTFAPMGASHKGNSPS